MIELLSTAEMAEADRLAVAGGVTSMVLMESAGRAVADQVTLRHPPEAGVTVLAGPGNNGGDGFVAARVLGERGYRPRVLLHGDAARLKGDAAEAFRRWSGPTKPAEATALQGTAVIVDALFGAGLDRPVVGQARDLIEAVNDCGATVYAVDLPSGVNGNSGSVMGAAVKASETVTFFRRKPGHLLLPGRSHCGRVHVADIGIPRTVLDAIRPSTFANETGLWANAFPVPSIDGHKYARGHAVVVSGGMSFTGAARLAARGALRAGAGLVTIASPPDALAVNAAASLAVMVRSFEGPAGLTKLLTDARRNALVIGPGGGVGEAMRDLVRVGLNGDHAVVLDADALTSFADNPAPLFDAVKRRRPASTILTPHLGEFRRVFKEIYDSSDVLSKLEKARRASELSGAVMLLKGADTVVASSDGRAAVAANAPSWLATAGSGDVLAGMVAGLLALRMPAFEATTAAVWMHGEAAAAFGPGLIAEDLPEMLPQVLRRLPANRNGPPAT